MNNYKFGVTGKERKELVTAISELLNTESQYLGIQKAYAYQIGEDLIVDKEGTAIGELPTDLLAELAERGFQAEIETVEEDAATEAEAETLTTPETEIEIETPSEPEVDTISITLPLDGFTPESLDNLCRMVTAKEPLIEKALGVEAIPIRVLENGIEFPWFRAEHSNDMMAYAQFITALCATAKEKKRVNAKPQEYFENERFTLRVWLIGLGLVGSEYSRIRQLLTKPLSGNGAWRFGTPEKAVSEAASAPETTDEAVILPDNAAGNAPADETPSDDESANVAEANADTAADESEVAGDE